MVKNACYTYRIGACLENRAKTSLIGHRSCRVAIPSDQEGEGIESAPVLAYTNMHYNNISLIITDAYYSSF